jgi:DNA-binding transcriptional MerR regulator
MPTKAPDAFRTISEVAQDLDLPQHVLRFWETRFAQIKPMKRGGGRRYYRPEDVDLLRGVRLLLYGEGFTIRGVQRLLKDKGVAFVVSAGQTGSVQTMTAADREAEAEDDDVSAVLEQAAQPVRKRRAAPPVHVDPPALEPVAMRAVPEPAVQPPPARTASPERRRRLQSALDDLFEAKRLLEQAR